MGNPLFSLFSHTAISNTDDPSTCSLFEESITIQVVAL